MNEFRPSGLGKVLPLSRALILLLGVASGCATLPARERAFSPSLCNQNAAFEAGFNDGDEGRAMGSDFLHGCREDLRGQGQAGYRDGYEKGRGQFEARMREMNANAQRNQSAIESQPPAPSSVGNVNNGGIQINIGGPAAGGGSGGATNSKAWYCSTRAFMTEYDSFGPTQLEARQLTLQKCTREHHDMHCRDVKCQMNR
jgi:hypothetical protein